MSTTSTNAPEVSGLPAVLTLDEVAAFLRCSKAHTSKLLRGKIAGVSPLPVVRIGRRVIVQRAALFEWLSEQTTGSVLG